MNMVDERRTYTRISIIREATNCLRSSNINDARRNVEWMLCELLKCNRAQLYAYPEMRVPAATVFSLKEMLGKRTNREPLQYILGHTQFLQVRIEVNPDVLIPRPETEWLVMESLQRIEDIKNPTILDVGTGSGCIALAIKEQRPDALVYACDISEGALEIARRNANRLALDIRLFRSDILQGIPPALDLPELDLLISNPPYIPRSETSSLEPEIVHFEPDIALFVDSDPLLYYRSISDEAPHLLRSGGYLYFETHMDFATEVKQMLLQKGFSSAAIRNDLNARPRIVSAQYHPREHPSI